MEYNLLNLILKKNGAIYGIVYDIGDFPTRLDLLKRDNADRIQDQILLFHSYDNFISYITQVIHCEDIFFIFSVVEDYDITKSFLSKYHSHRRENFGKEIIAWLKQRESFIEFIEDY